MKLIFKIAVILLIISSFYTVAESKDVQLSLSIEEGIYNSSEQMPALLSRLRTKLRYSKTVDSHHFKLQSRFDPVFFNDDQIYKLYNEIQLSRRGSAFSWLGRFYHRYFTYDLAGQRNTSINISGIGIDFFLPRNKNSGYVLSADYYYHKLNFRPVSQTDGLKASAGINWILGKAAEFRADMSAERYIISAESFDNVPGRNRGWRFAPKLSFRYSSMVMFDCSLSAAVRRPEHTGRLIKEYSLQAVGGTYLGRKTSVLVFVNFHHSESKIKDIPIYLLYTPVDFESRIDFKMSYDVLKSSEIYLRSGYGRDELPGGILTVSGAEIIAGFKVRF